MGARDVDESAQMTSDSRTFPEIDARGLIDLLDARFVIHDVSRFVHNAVRGRMSGIDRIDFIIMRDLLEAFGSRFVPIMKCFRGYRLLERERVRALLAGCMSSAYGLRRRHSGEGGGLAAPLFGQPLRVVMRRLARLCGDEPVAFFCASHTGVFLEDAFLRLARARLDCRHVFYLHDLIPLTHPEFSSDAARRRFARFAENVFAARPRVVCNSHYTASQVERHARGRAQGVWVLPPRLEWVREPEPARVRADVRREVECDPDYFVYVSTIEPRKNHALLLHLWRQAEETGMARPPRLHLVGRRGWNNENVFNLLDRSAAVRRHVREWGRLSDDDTLYLLRHARALLFPSFMEGLGLPVLEALKLGVPVIASDIPVFRELGPREGLRLIDPLDGRRWREAIFGA